MTRTLLHAGALSCALLTSTALTSPALAQTPSVYQHVDGNGVDLVDGSFNFGIVEGGIGSGETALALVRTFGAGGERDNLQVRFQRAVSGGQATIYIDTGNRRETFTGASTATSFTSGQAEGATLTKISAGEYSYRDADGTVTNFAPPTGLSDAGNNGYCSAINEFACGLVATSTVAPNGKAISYNWDVGENCVQTGNDGNGEPIFECAQFWRLRGMSNSHGYRVRFGFATEANPTSGLPGTDWHRRTGATFDNFAVSGSPTRTVSYATPSTGVTEITTDGGHVWRLTRDSQLRLSGIRRPGSSYDDATISYAGSTSLLVSGVTRDGIATGYSRSVAGSTGTMTVTDAASEVTTVVSDMSIGRPTSVTDPLSRTTSFQYDTSGRLTRTTAPEGNYVELTLDARGNVTQSQAVAKSGSGLSAITATATFPSSCTDPLTCNRPTSTTDARGNTTDYTYDINHGGVTAVTGPAPIGGADRPEARYAYTLTNGEYQLTSVSACASGTASSCVGTAAESRRVLAYDVNANVTSSETRDGTGALTATSAMTYTSAGDVTSVDGPLSGTADTTTFRYNQARQQVGAISADPDGSGSLTRRAVRTTYSSTTGLPTKQELGTVAGTGDTAWAAFSAAQASEVDYDAAARPVVQRLTSGSTTYALTQASYDSLGRPRCTAVRMNPNEFSSLPSDACTLDTEGTFGPDRISRVTHDAASQVTRVESGVGVSGVAADEITASYTSNGQAETLTDGEGNRTTYEYDGHDRLSRTRFPDTTQGAGTSSTTDYEELAHDAGGNVTSVRLRDGNSIAFTYDALGRPTFKNLPGGEPDVTFAYDLLGRLTGAAQTGHALTFTHDALGRRLTESGPMGTSTNHYDAAGRRVRHDYTRGPSGLLPAMHIAYDHLVTGEVTAVKENGTTTLGTYSHDSLGRRTGIVYGNGATSAGYGYDAAGRLATLSHDLAGTGADNVVTFAYNPAGQIISRDASNNSYAAAGFANQNVADTHNGLNQVTATGGATITHDANGNITSDGTRTYGYSSENRLTSVGGVGSYTYDPLGRLAATPAGYLAVHDGDRMTEEYNTGGARSAVYVPGPAMDEALASIGYLGDRYYLIADERGSVLNAVNESGVQWGTFKYDEYGAIMQNGGRWYSYTGQLHLPESGLLYYKARMYHPGLGRFLQPDPIWPISGMNGYPYVNGDPINLSDPSGLTPDPERCHLPGEEPCEGGKGEEMVVNAILGPRFAALRFSGGSGSGYGGGGGGGGGGTGGGGPDSLPDRCAARATSPRRGTPPAIVYADRLQSVAQAKFAQHLWPLNPLTGRPQSTFGGVVTSGEVLAGLAAELILGYSQVPAAGDNFRITADTGQWVGRDILSTRPGTNYLTVILSAPIPNPRAGVPEQIPISMHPGC